MTDNDIKALLNNDVYLNFLNLWDAFALDTPAGRLDTKQWALDWLERLGAKEYWRRYGDERFVVTTGKEMNMNAEDWIRVGENMQGVGWHNGHRVDFDVKPMPVGAIGDINSDAKGSGARYNGGKPPLELIPARWMAHFYMESALAQTGRNAVDAMFSLAEWQDRTANVYPLVDALRHLGDDGWIECARVFDYGRAKYAEWNWAKGMNWSIPFACAMRHLEKIAQGQYVDSESHLPHRGHVFCNIVMLLQFSRTFEEGDNRPAAGLL